MNSEIFSEKYEVVLRLVKKISPNLVNKISNFISYMPKTLQKCVLDEKSCDLMSVDKSIELHMECSMLELNYVNLAKSDYCYIYISPFYSSELKELKKDKDIEDHSMLIASYARANAEEVSPIKFYFDKIGDDYKFDRCEIPNNAVEVDFAVYLDYENNKYYLNYVICINDEEYKSYKKEISLKELNCYSLDKFDEFNLD